ncbi:integrase catalytic domain-containing protein [Trichonephila inaurata madagascariensis]|uniref:Integrase catalytic domain-containing protein n=1 Tax=Trichonephila inaurata madagascariensis TaxID=2747483 RepID=A0A8X6XP07_9ARAC|nr:integrase catalytic domain-containing protein [Trichonephila inaurata madagascariensis]
MPITVTQLATSYNANLVIDLALSRKTRKHDYSVMLQSCYLVNRDAILPIPEKELIANYKQPTTVRNLRKFRNADLALMTDASDFGLGASLNEITSDGFKSLGRELCACLGISKIRTTPYHPSSNGLVERTHRSLKAALMAHAAPCWTKVLAFVLLGLHSVIKEDFNATAAELVYGTTIRLPIGFFQDTGTNNVSEFVQQLKQTMHNLKPVPTSSHGRKTFFVHPELSQCIHVFLHNMMLSENHYNLPTMTFCCS